MLKKILLLSLMTLSGCFGNTKIIESGSLGKFTIGQSKNEVLNIITERSNILSIAILPYPLVTVKDPTLNTIKKFNNSDAIDLYVGEFIWPVIITLNNNQVTSISWHKNECLPYEMALPSACLDLKNIKSKISIGMNRSELYKNIVFYKTPLPKRLYNDIPGYAEFDKDQLNSPEQYKTILLTSNQWLIDGFHELEQSYDPYYSKITLYFENEKLLRIKYWSAECEYVFVCTKN
jgi:hypothetical protein